MELDAFVAELSEGRTAFDAVPTLAELATAFDIELAGLLRLGKRYGFFDIDLTLFGHSDQFSVELLSAGQLFLFSTVARLAAFVTRDCLVLIDEPELGLHPNWQSEFIPMLKKCMPGAWGATSSWQLIPRT